MEKQCITCGKNLVGNQRKYCCEQCADKQDYQNRKEKRKKDARDYHHKNFERDKLKSRVAFKKWYLKNKEKQKKNILNNYYKNKKEWNERKKTNRYRKEIFSILPNICGNCGKKEVKIVHHKEYGNWPKWIIGKGSRELNKQRRKRYYEKYLILFCSNLCHRRYEKNLREKANI